MREFKLKPLSVFLFIKSNLKKFLPQIFAVALGVFLVYFVCVIGGAIKYSIIDNNELPFKKLSIMYLHHNDADRDRYYKELKANPNVAKVIHTYAVDSILAEILVSEVGSMVFITSPEDTKYLMKTLHFNLVEGKIPNQKNELLINSYYAKNKNLKVGDYWGSDVSSKCDLIGKFKVVGICSGRIISAFEYGGDIKNLDDYSLTSLIVVPKPGKLHELNKTLLSYKKKNVGISIIENISPQLSTLTGFFNLFAIIILLITVFVLTFTISNVNYMHMYERCEEFALLSSMGYHEKQITTKLMEELMFIIGIGFTIGAIGGILGGYSFKILLCDPKGLPIDILNIWYLILSAAVPILVSICSTYPIIKFLNKMKPVDVLEGRY